jgi:hypothetical protein
MSGPMILSGTSLHAVSRGIEADADADDYDAFRMGRGLGFFAGVWLTSTSCSAGGSGAC